MSESPECQEENISIKGKVPDTINFKCPGGSECQCCDKKKDKNENICNEPPPPPKKTEEECKEPEPPKPKCNPMPKMSCQACQSQKDTTADQCAEGQGQENQNNIEDNPPPICTKLPDTKTFKCMEVEDECEPKEKNECVSDRKKKDCSSPSDCNTCGAPVKDSGKCNCGKPIPPPPKHTCGCKNKQGGPCLPNTSCEVLPLTMDKKRR